MAGELYSTYVLALPAILIWLAAIAAFVAAIHLLNRGIAELFIVRPLREKVQEITHSAAARVANPELLSDADFVLLARALDHEVSQLTRVVELLRMGSPPESKAILLVRAALQSMTLATREHVVVAPLRAEFVALEDRYQEVAALSSDDAMKAAGRLYRSRLKAS